MKTIIRFLNGNPQTLGLLFFFFLAGITSCKKNDTIEMSTTASYSGSFVKSGNSVVTSGTGTVTATFDLKTMILSYSITWNGLTSNAANMHFHDAGPVIYPIVGFAEATSGTFSGSVTLTSAQASDLSSGKIYVQIHTVNIPSGEILATLSQSSSSYSPSGGGYGY
jgi:CHRD domain.